jgi:hypothetical protein
MSNDPPSTVSIPEHWEPVGIPTSWLLTPDQNSPFAMMYP